jgi:3-isopropylmalate/(R)-2-methylmalate dehydratase small subunit
MDFVKAGRVWKFGDNINTDLIFPNRAFRLPEAEQHTLVFSANRPGWVAQVQAGDLVIAGKNFGMGSGRPIGKLLRACGISGLVCESINGLGLRNCINFGFPALVCEGITEFFNEGELARLDFTTGIITNLTKGKTIQTNPLAPLHQAIIREGGVINMLIAEGYIEPPPFRIELEEETTTAKF